GVLQPILVRPNGDGFILIAGARRLRAAKLADCATIPARVLELDDAAADEATIIENLHREDIHPLDEGEQPILDHLVIVLPARIARDLDCITSAFCLSFAFCKFGDQKTD
ncbi:MAG: ParB/RepB/Spo0J family partition protein, partial [Flavobacterium sp.]|nr:ParB/RepB/Spo0J family partition protein [Flavobacterium sp.]